MQQTTTFYRQIRSLQRQLFDFLSTHHRLIISFHRTQLFANFFFLLFSAKMR